MSQRSTRLGLLASGFLFVSIACGGSTASPPAASPSPSVAPIVKTSTATVAGKSETILVGANGMTLYGYLPDKGGVITCKGGCAANWPPLFLPSGQTTVSATTDITGKFTTAPHPDGKGTQVIYNDWPLYFWVKDTKPGDTTGQGVGGKWFVATPAMTPSI
jgi:predicted lipoprotein with Yx(FWY)xxD motif